MNRLSKAILIALAALMLIAASSLIGLNLYIQSIGTHARIEAELTKALHVPLRITSATVTPWGGLHLSGITMPPQDGSRLEANSFDADYRFLPLLHGRIVISKMTLDRPKIFWARSADGQWKLPVLTESPSPKEPHEPSSSKGGRISLDAFEINGGSIDLLDHDGQRVAFATDVHVEYRIASGESFRGALAAAQIAWQNAATFKAVRTPFTYKDGKFSFEDLHATLAGGTVSGSLTVSASGKETPFKLSLVLQKVDLAKVTTEANWPPAEAAGLLSGKIELVGDAHKFEETTGPGHLDLTDGEFGQLQLAQTIAQVLQLPGLSDLHIDTGTVDFHLSNEHVYITQCQLEKPDLRLTAKGNIRFDGRVSVDAALSITDRLAKGLPGAVRDSFEPPDSDGRRSIAFDISGHPDKLKTSLVDKILRRQVGSQFDSILSNIFGGDAKKKNKKGADAKAAPAGNAPAETPPAPGANHADQKPAEP